MVLNFEDLLFLQRYKDVRVVHLFFAKCKSDLILVWHFFR